MLNVSAIDLQSDGGLAGRGKTRVLLGVARQNIEICTPNAAKIAAVVKMYP